jgi:DNA-binding CsgD family transcriptional regulator
MAAESAGAAAEAALQFERALQLLDRVPDMEGRQPLDRVELLEHAAANRLEDPARAVEHIQRAIQLVDPAHDPVRAGLLQASLGRYLWFSGDETAALAACRQAAKLVPSEPPSVERARVTAGLGQILMILTHADDGLRYSREAVRLAAITGARGIEAHALNTLGEGIAYQGDVEGGLAMLRRSLEIAKEIGSFDDVGRAYASLQDILIVAGARYAEAGDLGIEALGPSNDPTMTGVWAAFIETGIAWARYLEGRWDEAQAALDRARLHPAGGVAVIEWETRAAHLLVGRGEFEAARRHVVALTRRLERSADMQWIAPAAAAQAELAIWTGDPDEALRVVANGLQRFPPTFGANISLVGPMLAFGVRASADQAERARARRRGEGIEAAAATGAEHLAAMQALRDRIAVRWPAHLRLAEPYLALCAAEASRLDGRSDPQRWRLAATLLEGMPQPYPAAYALYRECEALLAGRRDAGRARSALRDAYATALALGAAPLLAAVEAVARRGRVDLSGAGAGDRRRSAGPRGLTAREQEILALVAAGLSNRQIGERLFITEKTASHHVSNILAKLGVSGRAEAAAEAVSLGLTSPPG